MAICFRDISLVTVRILENLNGIISILILVAIKHLGNCLMQLNSDISIQPSILKL
jgi:hypothetical protein